MSAEPGTEEWKCCGCGAPSPERVRSCACPTNVVWRGKEDAWKVEPPFLHRVVTRLSGQPREVLARGALYWRRAYEDLVKQTGRDLNDGLGLDPRCQADVGGRTGVSADPGGTETKPEQNLHEKGSEG